MKRKDPICNACSPPGQPPVNMDLVFESKVEGLDTFRFTCPTCGGVVNLQTKQTPNGVMVRQVALDGSAREYKPWDSYQLRQNSAQGFDRSFDLTEEITPVFSVNRLDGFQAQRAQQQAAQAQHQQQVMARMHPQQIAAYQQQLALAQARAAAVARQGYQPVQQPVAYTLGQHANPVLLNQQELRRRMLGLPPLRRR